jgi:hypothetical protein
VTTREDEQTRAFERLFPAAPGPGRLRPMPPVLGVLAARTWHRASVAALLVGIAVLAEILLLSPRTDLLAFGAPILLLGCAGLLAGIAGLAWATWQLRARGERDATTWETWAASRRVVPAVATPLDGTPPGRRHVWIGSERLCIRRSRRYTQLYAARLGGGIPVTLCSAYLYGISGLTRNRGFGHFAALIELPAATAERFPASTLDRFVRGRRPWRGRGARLKALHLESRDFDDAADLRVDAGSDELDWYRLLDPPMLSSLASEWAVSWQQVGRTLVVYVPTPPGRLDARQLDALCAAAVGIGRRFIDVAELGDPSDADVEQLRTRMRARHVRRYRLRTVASWALALAVLAVPMIVSTHATLDQRSSRRDATRAIDAASAAADQVRECITAGEVDCSVTQPATTVTPHGNVLRITTTSERGTRYVTDLDRRDGTIRSQSCRPAASSQCDGGLWGSVDG